MHVMQALGGRARRGLLLLLCAAAPAAATAAVLNPDLSGLHVPAEGPELAWGSDATVWYREEALRRWRPAATPHHARIRALAATEGALIAVGDDGLLLRSTDGGRHWQADDAAAGRALVDVDCRGPRCLALGAEDLLLLSEDGGRHWTAAAQQGPAGTPTRLRAAAEGPWWVADAQGRLWRGSADGRHWQPQRLSSAGIDTLAVDGPRVLAASSDGRLHAVASAGGAARVLHRSDRGSYTRLQALPRAGAWVAIGTQGACAWRAHADGAWQRCDLPARRLLRGLASSPDGGRWVVAGEAGLLMHSDSQGRRWQAAKIEGLDQARHFEAVAWSAAREGFVAVGAGGLVLRSDREGRRWSVEHSAPAHYVHDVVQAADGDLLASLSHRTLARSHDGGRHWRSHRFTALQEPAYLFALHADRERGSLLAAGGQGSVMVAPDGRHWRHESLGHGRDYLGLLPLAGQPLVLLYGSGGTVLRVDTTQAAWQSVRLPTTDAVYGGFQDEGGQPWLTGADGLLLHSVDAGLHWQAQRVGQRTLRTGLAIEQGRVLLVAGDGGTLWRTRLRHEPGTAEEAGSDAARGQTWLRIATADADWSWLLPDAAGRALWLGGSGGQLMRSFDGGMSWTPQPLPTTSALRRPVYDARRRQWWMPGRDGTLLHSADDGASWQRVETHTREHLKGAWVDPASGDLLLYGARLVHLAAGETP